MDATAREISQGGMEVRVPQKRLRSISGEDIGGKLVMASNIHVCARHYHLSYWLCYFAIKYIT